MSIRMQNLLVGLILTASLAGCGNDPAEMSAQLPLKDMVSQVFAAMAKGKQGRIAAPAAPDANAVAGLRAVLEEAGTPIYALKDPGTGLVTFVAKIGDNTGVGTWSTTDYRTIGLRDGIIVATRGFGSDMMSAEAPNLAVIAAGSGSHARAYYYLDGADQSQVLRYDCALAVAGSETIEILGKPHATRRITETCTGKSGSFVNEYWFEGGSKLRQTSQLRVQGVGNMFLQQIIE